MGTRWGRCIIPRNGHGQHRTTHYITISKTETILSHTKNTQIVAKNGVEWLRDPALKASWWASWNTPLLTSFKHVESALDPSFTVTVDYEPSIYPSLWYSGIGSRLRRNRLRVRSLAVSDIYPMFIEPTITLQSLRGSLGTYGLTQKLC